MSSNGNAQQLNGNNVGRHRAQSHETPGNDNTQEEYVRKSELLELQAENHELKRKLKDAEDKMKKEKAEKKFFENKVEKLKDQKRRAYDQYKNDRRHFLNARQTKDSQVKDFEKNIAEKSIEDMLTSCERSMDRQEATWQEIVERQARIDKEEEIHEKMIKQIVDLRQRNSVLAAKMGKKIMRAIANEYNAVVHERRKLKDQKLRAFYQYKDDRKHFLNALQAKDVQIMDLKKNIADLKEESHRFNQIKEIVNSIQDPNFASNSEPSKKRSKEE